MGSSGFDHDDIYLSTLSGTLSGAAAGADAGSAAGPMGTLVGAVFGAVGGFAIGIWGNNYEVNNFIDQVKTSRNAITRERNTNIIDIQKSIADTRSNFDSTYGKGMFDQYDSLFMEILGMKYKDSLSVILDSMQIDTVSGVIKSRLSGKATEEMLTGSLSVSDINQEYLSYLKEQMRAQDTTFGIQMQSYALEDSQAWSSYYKSVGQASLQYAQQFASTFLNYRAENVEGETAMGKAALNQAASGIRQQGSGTSLTTMQQFQNDLSKVAQASMVKYLLKSYGYAIDNATDNVIYQSYQRRQNIKASTSQQLSNLIAQYNAQNSENSKAYMEMVDEEAAVDLANDMIKDANENRSGISTWWNNRKGDERETLDTVF